MYILSWIVIGAVAGWVTGMFVKGNQYGPWVDIVSGIAGALAGGFLILYGGLPGRLELVSTTLSAILGAVVFTVIAASISRRRRYA
jgi:uncharacterized membrane protein YeaQ/YmgE (transglycosylase-associated protein family)